MTGSNTLPLLDQIQIASPCTADWSAMTGDDRSRYCGQCRKHVYNLSAMTREEAEALIVAKEGAFCGRMFRRTDGTVLTRDCPVGVTTLRRRIRRACVAAVLLGATLFAGVLHACGLHQTARGIGESGALARLKASLEPQLTVAFGGIGIPPNVTPVFSVPVGGEATDP